MQKVGILGINARNLYYIKKFNPKKSIRLADNKLKTKIFVSERGIPVPETFGVIKNRQELFNFDFTKLPAEEFIIKPNRGSKGKGIYRVKIIKEINGNYKVKKNWFGKLFKYLNIDDFNSNDLHFKLGGDIYDEDTFRRYLTDIVDGQYSLPSLGRDKILIEEKMIPSIGFSRYCKHGLADIRIIVFNLIPVAAMIRVPTIGSNGRANINQGGIGLGVEVGSGKIKTMYYKGQIFTKDFQGEFKDYYMKRVPYWNDLLFFSSKIQYFVNLGYLALDWVITDQGPKLLEINARAGLEVQNASFLGLRKRLEKVSDIKVDDPEKGVEIARSLFTTAKSNFIVNTKVLYLSQKARLIFESEDEDEKKDIFVKVNLNNEKNYISKKLGEKIEKFDKGEVILDIYNSEIRFKNLKFIISDKLPKNYISLGKNILSEYYVKPIHKVYSNIDIINPKNLIEEELDEIQLLDEKIFRLNNKLNLSFKLKPVNYLDELDNFITWHGRYNPKFKYRRPDDVFLDETKSQLWEIKEKFFTKDFGLKSKFASLFNDKIDELLLRNDLIRAYRDQDFNKILDCNLMQYGQIDQDLLESIHKGIFKTSDLDKEEILGKKMSITQIKKAIKKYLLEKGIEGVKILIDDTNLSRISVVRGKKLKIRISNRANFREKELLSVLAHEIDGHFMRYQNGTKTGFNLLRVGTADYLKDEEGIAIYNSMKYLEEQYKICSLNNKYYLANEASKCSFVKLTDLLRAMNENRTYIGIFKSALRFKKGIENTSIVSPGTVYLKDKIYLEGYYKIKDWINKGANLDDLMIGKIKIEDLDFIN